MWKRRERKPLMVDTDHIKTLHQEAAEQLDLMRTALEASEPAAGTMRDILDTIVENHWHSYLDIIHLITMHDESYATIMKKQPSLQPDDDINEYAERKFTANRTLLIVLLAALIRRHHRMIHLGALLASPMNNYYQESMTMEKEHIAELLAIIQHML